MIILLCGALNYICELFSVCMTVVRFVFTFGSAGEMELQGT
jgi:hypothetical protein